MKRVKFILFFAITGLLHNCENELNIAPTDKADSEEVFKTAEAAEAVVIGSWAALLDNRNMDKNGYSTLLRTSDAMGSDVAVVVNQYGYGSAYSFSSSDNTDYSVYYIWILLYSAINNMNNVIARIDNVNGTSLKKDQVKGQAKALRAFCYLNLASFYQFSYLKDKKALSVPVYTEPTTSSSTGKKRVSLEEIYVLIKNDLVNADQLLQNYDRNNKDKINRSVVNGLLARAYLNTGEWNKAVIASQRARIGFPLMSTKKYKEGFNDINNEEWIWGHGQTQEQSEASYAFHFLDVSTPGSQFYSFMADPYFKDLFDSNDVRYELFKWDGLPGREGLLRYEKFKFKPGFIADIVLMRSAEMLLIEAEAEARNGNVTKAVALLNQLKAARGAHTYSDSQQNKVVEEILIERRKELFGEGFSLADIIRTQGQVYRKPFVDNNGLPIHVQITTPDGTIKSVEGRGHSVFAFPDQSAFVSNSKYYLFKIPISEFENNPNL